VPSSPRFLKAVFQYQWDLTLLRDRERVRTSGETYEWEIPYEELQLLEKLGEGTFGIVRHRIPLR
jgi:hypothetical protein